MLPNVDFRAIRPHNGSQELGFEELCYQLIPALEKLPEGSRVRRLGTPDGGTEALCYLPDGSKVAWQAKYFFTFGTSQFQQMDRSVKRAIEKHRQLTRYIFCFPSNLPAVTPNRGKSAWQKWDEYTKRWQEIAHENGISIEFEYQGKSELLKALGLAQNHGRILYWFQTQAFGPDWFQETVERMIEDASDRYDPELNVPLSIALAFESLGRTPEFETELKTLLGTIRQSRRWWPVREIEKHDPDLIQDIENCNKLLNQIDSELINVDVPGLEQIPIASLIALSDQAMATLYEKANQISERADKDEQLQREQATSNFEYQSLNRDRRSAAYHLRKTARAVEEFKELLKSERASLANTPALLVTGTAGGGKTHLFCEIARMRSSQRRPTILLLGQKFAEGEPWNQILDQLHLKCSVDEFPGALDAAAETCQSRALILIDALNEGRGIDVWRHHLAGFLQKIRKWPRLAVAVSCRASYISAVIPDQLDNTKLVRLKHEGFAGNEYRAIRAFFDHYKLRLPDFPLLVPEFQNPLFLKLMCRGLQKQGNHTIPRGSTGITWLFRTFLKAANDNLAKADRCDFPAEKNLAEEAAYSLAEEMLRRQETSLEFSTAESLTNSILPGRGWSKSLLYGLISEGVLIKEYMGSQDEGNEVILFTYERLGDYLRAVVLCNTARSLENLATECSKLTKSPLDAYQNSGLLEALSILVPERFQKELHEVVPKSSLNAVQESYLNSLLWRDPSAFKYPVSLDYINSIAGLANDRVLETLLQTACIPNHPFNAHFLHSNLRRQKMPNRDSWWSTFLYSNYYEGSPVARIIDWAWSKDTSYCADDAALLCSITLAWFLTTSARTIRDRATKALISLLKDRPSVLVDLLDKFQGVNDPYVSERIYAVAYGCTLLTSDKKAVCDIVTKVYEQVFVDDAPPVHILLRDYARGIILRAEHLECLPDEVDLNKTKPPYRSPWPIRALSEQDLKDKYYDEKDWLSIWLSVVSHMGDFHRYIIESKVTKFLAPNQSSKRYEANKKAKAEAREAWEIFMNSLSKSQTKVLKSKNGAKIVFENLTQEQQNLLRNASTKDSRAERTRTVLFDASLASRWVFNKVVRLGWRPKLHGQFDGMLRYEPMSRMEQSVERIGKKYQWIAFYELMARIADHCIFHDLSEEPTRYEGPWQLYLRNIDPSLTMTAAKAIHWEGISPSWVSPVAPTFPEQPERLHKEEWTSSPDDLPNPEKLIQLRDEEGRQWLTLEGHYNWEEPVAPDQDRFDSDRCTLWYQIRSYLIRRDDLARFLSWARGKNWMGRWMPESYSTHGMFLGEYPWHPSARNAYTEWTESENYSTRSDGPSTPLRITTSAYHWGSDGYDRSMDDSINAIVPNLPLIDGLRLSWSGRNFIYENQLGSITAFDPSAELTGPPVLLVNREDLLEYLAREKLSIAWTVLGEKLVHGPNVQSSPRLYVYGCLYLKDGKLERLNFSATSERI